MTQEQQPTRPADVFLAPAGAPKPRRHLMTPGVPRPAPRRTSRSNMSTAQVQKWVLTVLAGVTIGHLSAGIVVAALAIPEDKTVPRIGLLVIGGLIGILAAVAIRAIHQKPPVSLWLLGGTVPALVGAYLGFWR